MKKNSLSKALAIVLMLAMVLSVMTPLSVLSSVAAEAEEPFHYAPSAFSKEQLLNDGWVATKNDGTAITTYDESVYAGAARNDFWWRLNADGSVQGQGNVDCESNFGKAQQSLTYTGKWLNDFNMSFSTNVSNYNYRVSFSIGVNTPGEYYKDETSPSNVITFTTNPETSSNYNINRLQIKGAALKDGTAECTIFGTGSSPSLYYFTVKVYGKYLYVACNNKSYEFELNENYVGGYIQFTSPNSYASFYPPEIDNMVQEESEYKIFSYSKAQMTAEGWVATKNDGTAITTYDDSVINAGSRADFWWLTDTTQLGARIIGQGNTDCESNFGKAYQNLTYTGKEYKNFNLKFKTGAKGYHAGSGFSIGVKNAGELYLGDTSPSNVITAMTSLASNGDITQFTVSGAALADGAQTFTITKDSNNLFDWDITVLGKYLEIKCNDSVFKLTLNDNYVGGYVQLTVPNSYSYFYPLTITTDNLSADGIDGDIDMDTLINAGDLTLLKKVLLSIEAGLNNSDVNGDGYVDIRDMVNLKKKLAVIAATKTADFNTLYEDGYVSTVGRAGMVEDSYHMAFVNSGFEITGEIQGDVIMSGHRDTDDEGIQCFLNIIVDGEFSKCSWVGVEEATLTLATGLEKGVHTIRVEKAYSISCGAYVPTAITYTGDLNVPAAEDKLTIEVLGDSMTDGIGTSTVGSSNAWDSKSGGNNSYYSYAAVMARELDAELSAVSLAGEGITNIHKNYYPYISYGQKGEYDFSQANEKDIVLINLGTNGIYDYNTVADCTYDDIYIAASDLLVDVRNNNPNAYIIWAYAMMANDSTWYEAYEAAVADMKDEKIIALDLSGVYGSAVEGYDSLHPSCEQYEAYGKFIAKYIKDNIFGETTYDTDAAYLSATDAVQPLGRAMTYGDEYIMDYTNSGFVLKGEIEGNVEAEFTTNRIGTLLNVSVDGGENKVVELVLDGKTTLAEGLEKGTHTIEVTSGTSMYYTEAKDHMGTLRLEKLYYTGTLLTYTDDKELSMLFLGDSITCGMGLDTSVNADTTLGMMKASNAYYSYASVLGRSLNAKVDVAAKCGAKTNLFAWDSVTGEKGPVNAVNWVTSVNLLGTATVDYASNPVDVVVINLGTNDPQTGHDWFWSGDGNAVATMLNKVHNLYPDAKIVWTLGMMCDGSDSALTQISNYNNSVNEWANTNGVEAYFCDLSSVADRTGYGSHPTIEGHAAAAAVLEQFMIDNEIIVK